MTWTPPVGEVRVDGTHETAAPEIQWWAVAWQRGSVHHLLGQRLANAASASQSVAEDQRLFQVHLDQSVDRPTRRVQCSRSTDWSRKTGRQQDAGRGARGVDRRFSDSGRPARLDRQGTRLPPAQRQFPLFYLLPSRYVDHSGRGRFLPKVWGLPRRDWPEHLLRRRAFLHGRLSQLQPARFLHPHQLPRTL